MVSDTEMYNSYLSQVRISAFSKTLEQKAAYKNQPQDVSLNELQ